MNAPQGNVRTATIVRLVQDRGFGFLKDNQDGGEYFFHRTAVVGTNFDNLTVRDQVYYDVSTSDNKKGPRADNVRVQMVER